MDVAAVCDRRHAINPHTSQSRHLRSVRLTFARPWRQAGSRRAKSLHCSVTRSARLISFPTAPFHYRERLQRFRRSLSFHFDGSETAETGKQLAHSQGRARRSARRREHVQLSLHCVTRNWPASLLAPNQSDTSTPRLHAELPSAPVHPRVAVLAFRPVVEESEQFAPRLSVSAVNESRANFKLLRSSDGMKDRQNLRCSFLRACGFALL